MPEHDGVTVEISGTNARAIRSASTQVVQAILGGDAEPHFRSIEQTLGDWDAQLDLSWIVGLLLRGWRKGAVEAEASVTLASGVPAGADLAWWCDRAVEAARRRL